jgi:hypothetical protein
VQRSQAAQTRQWHMRNTPPPRSGSRAADAGFNLSENYEHGKRTPRDYPLRSAWDAQVPPDASGPLYWPEYGNREAE